jgi:hypothetical protein
MDIKIILIGLILMVPLIAVKFIPALLFLGPFLICFVCCACAGMIMVITGIAKFTNVQRFANVEKEEEEH